MKTLKLEFDPLITRNVEKLGERIAPNTPVHLRPGEVITKALALLDLLEEVEREGGTIKVHYKNVKDPETLHIREG